MVAAARPAPPFEAPGFDSATAAAFFSRSGSRAGRGLPCSGWHATILAQMTSSIRKFWQDLEAKVHPQDEPVLASRQHTFNLDYPPPAFIGDVDNAPVVILMLNGGYGSDTGSSEFPTPADMREHVQWLKGEQKEPPRRLSSYYTTKDYYKWVLAGDAVVVNACAYRSRKLTKERHNQKIAEHLPSVKAHRDWLKNEVLPAAKSGSRLIAVHRWSLWDFAPKVVLPATNVHYSSCPRSQNLDCQTQSSIAAFLRARSRHT